nr:MAG TPA: SynN [Caudoviricetes sp.]
MAYLGNLENFNDEKNWTVKITDYKDFRTIVKAKIRYMHPDLTDKDMEECIEKGGGYGIMDAIFNENKKDFAEGRYVYSQAGAAAMNYW